MGVIARIFGKNEEQPEVVPYRVEYEAGGMLENNDGSFTVYTLKKSYGYWGNILKAEVESRITRA